MAEEVEEEPKKSNLLKIIIFVVAGLLLIVVGLGIGYFIFGGEPEPDPSAEVNQIIEGKEAEKKEKEKNENDEEGEEVGEDGLIKKNVKAIPEVDSYETTYFEFPGDFTTNLKGSRKFLQVSVGVSTQYDETVIENVEMHQLALRSEVLGVVSEFTVEEVEGKLGRDDLADGIKNAINARLEELEGFGGVEGVYFTAFVLQ